MRRSIALSAVGAAVLLAVFPFVAAAQASDIVIEKFSSALSIEPDGRVKVVESIDARFEAEKHGIYRDIPLAYENADGTRHYTSVVVESVANNSAPHPYEVSDNATNMRIKIGDPDALVAGLQHYVITYYVSGVISRYESFDELYWNVTGNGWEESILEAGATLSIPGGVIMSVACYQGGAGSGETCRADTVSDTIAHFGTTRTLASREGMTVAAGFTKGIVPILEVEGPPPFEYEKFLRELVLAFVVTFVAGAVFLYRLWSRYGRDRYRARKHLHDTDAKEIDMPLNAEETIVVEYEPPARLRPAEIGVIMDERADTLDVSATIVDLAARGYLTIKEVPKTWIFGSTDYELVSTKKDAAELLQYERSLLEKLFAGRESVALSDLKNDFYTSLAEVKKDLYKDVVQKGFFLADPEKIRNWYRVAGIIVAFVGGANIYLGTALGLSGWLMGFGTAVTVVGMALVVIASAMPRRTALGRELYRQARGYKLFVSGTEKYRQPFFEKKNIFMEVLPYAIIFGVTSQLAKAMKDMGIEPPAPSWYAGATPFNIAAFGASMNSFESSLSSAISSAPGGSGSGGGGFSGGGFGGGGGGGW